MTPGTDPVAAYLAEVAHDIDYALNAEHGRADAVFRLMKTHSPHLLAAVEAVLRITDGWRADAQEAPLLSREVAPKVIREVISRELLGKEAIDAD
jgi:hypothetical protein